MINSPITEYLNAVKEREEKAHHEINGLASGKRRWEMSIPVRKTDSDMTLQAPLDDLEVLREMVSECVDAISRRMKSDEACERHFDEDLGAALNAITELSKRGIGG